MDSPGRKATLGAALGEAVLGRVAATLSRLYQAHYGERAVDPRASSTGDLLAFAFAEGLSARDRWMLHVGRGEALRQFRRTFFEVVGGEMAAAVSDLTGLPVLYSFSGFDPRTRTTHAVFVLDLGGTPGGEPRPSG